MSASAAFRDARDEVAFWLRSAGGGRVVLGKAVFLSRKALEAEQDAAFELGRLSVTPFWRARMQEDRRRRLRVV